MPSVHCKVVAKADRHNRQDLRRVRNDGIAAEEVARTDDNSGTHVTGKRPESTGNAMIASVLASSSATDTAPSSTDLLVTRLHTHVHCIDAGVEEVVTANEVPRGNHLLDVEWNI